MKVCTKIFGESGGDNRDIANKMNEQIEEWKEDCLEDEDKIINVESINIIPNDKGIFATVRYTYSVIIKKELLLEKIELENIETEKKEPNQQFVGRFQAGGLAENMELVRELIRRTEEQRRLRFLDPYDNRPLYDDPFR